MLNIKGLPYETHWLLHPEIEPKLRRIGASPTVHWILKTETYTLPVIFDPTKNAAISDSNEIASYLEEMYPESRPLRVADAVDFVNSLGRRLNEALHNGRGRMGIWLYAQARRALNASQSWLVVSLVGACSHPHP